LSGGEGPSANLKLVSAVPSKWIKQYTNPHLRAINWKTKMAKAKRRKKKKQKNNSILWHHFFISIAYGLHNVATTI